MSIVEDRQVREDDFPELRGVQSEVAGCSSSGLCMPRLCTGIAPKVLRRFERQRRRSCQAQGSDEAVLPVVPEVLA